MEAGVAWTPGSRRWDWGLCGGGRRRRRRPAGGPTDEIYASDGVEVGPQHGVRLRPALPHGGADLPDVVGDGGAGGELQGGEDDEVAAARLRCEVGHWVVYRGADDVAVAGDVVGVGDDAAVRVLVGEECSGAQHDRSGGVDPPRHPTRPGRRRGDEGDGEGGVGGRVGEVEGGAKGRELQAGSKHPVIGEPGGAASHAWCNG